MPCPSDGAAGIPALEQVLLLYTGVRFLWAMPALRDPSTNCSCIALHPETYCVKGPEDFSSFEPSALPPLLTAFKPFSASLLSPRCLQAVPSALLRFAEELLLGRAVSLQCCPLAVSSLPPRSPAQPGSRGPAQGILMTPPVGLVPSP